MSHQLALIFLQFFPFVRARPPCAWPPSPGLLPYVLFFRSSRGACASIAHIPALKCPWRCSFRVDLRSPPVSPALFFACCAASFRLGALAGPSCLLWWPVVVVWWRVGNACRGDGVTGSSGVPGYASAARLELAGLPNWLPSSCGVATATRLCECSPRALDGFSRRLPRARSALGGLGRRANLAGAARLPKALDRGSPPVAYLAGRVTVMSPFTSAVRLAVCKP